MKRFIDIGTQTGNTEVKEFCFFDTVTDQFETFQGECCWTSAKEFTEHYDGNELDRYLSLIPVFPEKQLRFKQSQGSRILSLKGREINNKREMIIMCEEHRDTEDPNLGNPEKSEAGYFLYENEIDELIKGLEEAKMFLNGC